MSNAQLPEIDYDPEIEIDGIITVTVGSLTLWFVAAVEGDHLIAFEMDDSLGKTCWNPDESCSDDVAEIIRSFPGRRCARCLDSRDFVANWESRTAAYLFPKKVGRLRVDLPLHSTVPLDILADWLEDHEHVRAAEILRQHHEPDSHKKKHKLLHSHLLELLRDYRQHNAEPIPSLAELLAWSESQTRRPTETQEQGGHP